jgi:hypothetical protein
MDAVFVAGKFGGGGDQSFGIDDRRIWIAL